MTEYYGIVNDTLLQSIKVFGKDIAVYDGFQEYRYGYFPNEKKFQVLATLENAENARSVFIIPSIINQTFAASLPPTGYAYIKGNFTSTGDINNLVVDGATWNGKTPVNGIKNFSGSEAIIIASPIAVVPETNVPADGQCGTANGQLFTATPTTNLCMVGTATGMLDNDGVVNKWTWGCTGVNGGVDISITSCKASFDNSYHCIFDDPSNLSKFGDGTTNYCTFAP